MTLRRDGLIGYQVVSIDKGASGRKWARHVEICTFYHSAGDGEADASHSQTRIVFVGLSPATPNSRFRGCGLIDSHSL